MKKVIIFLVVGFIFVSAAIVYAAPVGNIAKPAMLKSAMLSKDNPDAAIGLIGEGEFDFSSDLKVKGTDEKTKYQFLGGKADVVFKDKFIFYGLLGGASFETKFTDVGADVKIESDTNLAWGIGATAILYETAIQQLDNSMLRFGIDGRYRDSKIDINKIIINGKEYSLSDAGVGNASLKYKDWQVAAEASLQWKRLVPYVGVKYSDFNIKETATVLGTTYTDDSAKHKNKVGVFVGTDLLVLDSASVNVEGRFIDETALTLGCAVRF